MQAQSVCDRAAVVRRVQLSVTQSMIHWGQWCMCCYCVGLCWRTPELMKKLRVRNFYHVRGATWVCVIVSAESGWVCLKVQRKSGFFFFVKQDAWWSQEATSIMTQWDTMRQINIPRLLHYDTNCHIKFNLKMFSVSIMKIWAQSLPIPLVFENPHTPQNRGTRGSGWNLPLWNGENFKTPVLHHLLVKDKSCAWQLMLCTVMFKLLKEFGSVYIERLAISLRWLEARDEMLWIFKLQKTKPQSLLFLQSDVINICTLKDVACRYRAKNNHHQLSGPLSFKQHFSVFQLIVLVLLLYINSDESAVHFLLSIKQQTDTVSI